MSKHTNANDYMKLKKKATAARAFSVLFMVMALTQINIPVIRRKLDPAFRITIYYMLYDLCEILRI